MPYQVVIEGDALETLTGMDANSVNSCVTSPPYFGLRSYDHHRQIGLEETPDEYIRKLVLVFREVHRVLRKDGTLWVNMGDTYATRGGTPTPHHGQLTRGRRSRELICRSKRLPSGVGNRWGAGGDIHGGPGMKHKDLLGMPWRLAFALQADGWWLRQDIIWAKPNPMPESVKDRCTKSHEYVFLLSKSARYFYDRDAILEPAVGGPRKNKPNPKEGEQFRTRGKLHEWQPTPAPRERGNAASFRGGGKYTNHASFQNGADAPRKSKGNVPNENGTRNRRDVWTLATVPYKGSHSATFPVKLAELMVLASCPADGVVLDCFGGAGTTGVAAKKHGRSAILLELNPAYAAAATDRLARSHG